MQDNEPIEYFEYQGQSYPVWGYSNGKSHTTIYDTGKFNRYAKLGKMANSTVNELKEIIVSESVHSRCAYACLLMMKYGIRVGNEDSAEGYESGLKDNKGELVHTYGVTTLLNEHVVIEKDYFRLAFLGKEQVSHNIVVADPFLVAYGFKYIGPPDQKWLGIDYDTLFKFVKSHIGAAFVPKDFRTFCANVTAWDVTNKYLNRVKSDKKSEVNKEVAEIVEAVSKRLGNTPGIAKKNYIDNRLFDWFKQQRLVENQN